MIRLLAAGLTILAMTVSAAAGERGFLGHGRLVVNDVFVGPHDRWQTASVASSYLWGREWQGRLPGKPGELVEFRLLGRIVAPSNLAAPDPRDRPYANALSFGLHTHFAEGGTDIAVGADLVVTGDQTGLYHIQQTIHDVIGIAGPSDATRARGIGNGFHPAGVIEFGHEFAVEGGRLRPFLEARAGVETLIRAGVDLTLGPVGQGGLLVRDPVTGHRYRAVKGRAPGVSLVLGADYAAVADSIFLPAPAYDPLHRARLRAGLHWERDATRLFYGIAWLSEEFAGQPEGQLVGALRINISF